MIFLYVKCKITRGNEMLRIFQRVGESMLLVGKGVEWYWTFRWEPGPKGTVLSKNLRQIFVAVIIKSFSDAKYLFKPIFEKRRKGDGGWRREGMREWIKIWLWTQAVDPRASVPRQGNSKMIVQDPQRTELSAGWEQPDWSKWDTSERKGRRERKQTSRVLLR